jgi:translation initiation factor 3 subunit L
MAHQRVALWAAESDLDDDINDADVDIPIPMPSSTNEMYDDPNLQLDEGSLQAMQQHIAQQAAFAQIPDVVKRVSILLFSL